MDAPYHSLPEAPGIISTGAAISRLLDGIGFRYHRATEGLTDADLAFAPAPGSMSLEEVLRHIHELLRWVGLGAGDETRPDKAKVSILRAAREDERELLSLATVPFDDRYNQGASIEDLSRRLMEEFSRKVASDFAASAPTLPIVQLGRQFGVVGGPSERPFPRERRPPLLQPCAASLLSRHPDRRRLVPGWPKRRPLRREGVPGTTGPP